MADTKINVRLSNADDQDIKTLVEKGVFTNFSDATRSIIRKGIESIKRERGLA